MTAPLITWPTEGLARGAIGSCLACGGRGYRYTDDSLAEAKLCDRCWPSVTRGAKAATATALLAYRLIGPPPSRWASLGPVLLAAADRAGDYLASDEYRAMVTAVDSDHRQIQRDGEDLLRRIEVCS